MTLRGRLSIVGLDFQEASLDMRVKGLQTLIDLRSSILPSVAEFVEISTCNRVEIVSFDAGDSQRIINAWSDLVGSKEAFVCYQDFDAVRHLFRVASSLESMVVGETQIIGQVKAAYERASESRSAGTILHRLFQRAFRVAKKIRSETEVGRFPVSIPSIAVKLAEKVVGDLSRKTVAVVGLGDMGRLAAEYFGSLQPQRLLLLSRRQEISHDLVAKLRAEKVQAVVAQDVASVLSQAQVIVSAASTEVSLDARQLEGLSQRVFIDLSVPTSLNVADWGDHYHFSIDDLRKIAEENRSFRQAELDRAETIIQQETERFWQSLKAFLFQDIFESLEEKLKVIRQEELKELRSRLSDLSESDWIMIEKTAQRMIYRVLQEPMQTVKQQLETSDNREGEGLVSYFRHLFKV